MPTIEITASVANITAFADSKGYQDTIPNPETLEDYKIRTGGEAGYELIISNPVNRLQFSTRFLKNLMRKEVVSYRVNSERKRAGDVEEIKAKDEVIIT